MADQIPPPPPGFVLQGAGAPPPSPARPSPAPARAPSAPRGVRNGNDGNLKATPYSQRQPGYVGADPDGFAIFDTPENGRAAQERLLASNYAGQSPTAIINRYAPVGPENSPESVANYIAHVSGRLGIDPNAPVPVERVSDLAEAMREFENGTDSSAPVAPAAGASIATPPEGFVLQASSPQPGAHGSSRETAIDLTQPLLAADVPLLKKGAWVTAANGETYELPGDSYIGAPDGSMEQQSAHTYLDRPDLNQSLEAFGTAASEQIPFMDEAVAGVAGLTSGRGYDAIRDQQMLSRQLANQTDRGARIGGGLAGFGLGLLAPGGAALKGSTGLLSASVRAGALGAGYGALYGAGNTDGGIEDRARGALVGGVTGGVLGAATPTVVNAGRAIVERSGSGLSEVGARVQRGLGIQPAEASVTPQATESATGFVGDLLRRSGGDLTANPAIAQGKPITAAEAIGPAAVSQMVALTRRSGRTGLLAEGQLGARAADQSSRVLQDFADITGADPAGVADVIANLAQQGRRTAAPLYEQAYSRPGVVRSPLLEELLNRPSVRKAMNNAVAIAKEEGRDPTTLGFDFDAAGDVLHVREPSMQTLDYIKRGLDDVVNGYRDSTTRRLNLDTQGRAVVDTAKNFRDELVRLNPTYGDALQAGGDPIRLEDAFSQGARLFSTGVNERVFAERLARMSEADRGALVAGLADSLFTKSRNNQLRIRDLTAPAFQGKLTQVLGPEAASDFTARVQSELNLSRTGSRMAPNSNSPTAEATAAMAEQDKGVGLLSDWSRNVESGGVLGGTTRTMADLVASPVAGFIRGAQAPSPQAVRDEIGRLLLLPPEELVSLLASRPIRKNYRGLLAPASAPGQLGGLLAPQ